MPRVKRDKGKIRIIPLGGLHEIGKNLTVIEYNNEDRPDKPTKEIVHEAEKLIEATSIVDRQGLKQIASALRDIKEVQMLKSELDRQEQEARIANLQKQAEKGDGDQGKITVVLEGALKDYAQ